MFDYLARVWWFICWWFTYVPLESTLLHLNTIKLTDKLLTVQHFWLSRSNIFHLNNPTHVQMCWINMTFAYHVLVVLKNNTRAKSAQKAHPVCIAYKIGRQRTLHQRTTSMHIRHYDHFQIFTNITFHFILVHSIHYWVLWKRGYERNAAGNGQ